MKLARINNLLVIIIIAINGYIVALPIAPGLWFILYQHSGQQAVLERKVRDLSHTASSAPNAPQDNRLIIASMLLDQAINEGKGMRTLNKGLWRRPASSTPDKGGNTVIVGHRLTYSNPRGTLYSLDKVRKGDNVSIWWHGKIYGYTVTDIKTVHASEISIEAQTVDPQLTIYTCTPLWLPKDRLVVIARPNKEAP